MKADKESVKNAANANFKRKSHIGRCVDVPGCPTYLNNEMRSAAVLPVF